MVILPTIILFIQLAAGCFNKEEGVQCIDAAVGEGGSWPTIPNGGVLNWEIKLQQKGIPISYASSTGPFYIGPVNGKFGLEFTPTTIKQKFACSYDSTVAVKYRYYQCGTLDGPEKAGNEQDFFKLTIDDETQPDSVLEGGADDVVELEAGSAESTRLESAVEELRKAGSEGCDTNWAFKDFDIKPVVAGGGNPLVVKKNKAFEVMFVSDLTGGDKEWIALSSIQVICIAEDEDKDRIADTIDNCRGVYNPYQKDLDHDGKGDKCDYDIDGDYIPNKYDYCPTKPGSYYNYGCPPEYKQYGKGGRGDEGKGQGGYRYDTGNRDGGKGDKGYSYRGGNGGGYDGNNNKDDKGQGGNGGRYGYDGGNRDTGRGARGGRGRSGSGSGSGSGSNSGSYSSSDSSSRGGRSRNRYERDNKDEGREMENLLRELEYKYRGSSKY